MRQRLAWILMSAITLAGCASQGAKRTETIPLNGVSRIQPVQRPVDDPRAVRDTRPITESSPVPIRQVLPHYPDSAIDDAVACVARILYHVETTGGTKLVRLTWDEPPPPHHREAFEQSIATAIEDWSFRPAFRLEIPDEEGGWNNPVTTPIPKARTALIHFTVEDGVPVVR